MESEKGSTSNSLLVPIYADSVSLYKILVTEPSEVLVEQNHIFMKCSHSKT